MWHIKKVHSSEHGFAPRRKFRLLNPDEEDLYLRRRNFDDQLSLGTSETARLVHKNAEESGSSTIDDTLARRVYATQNSPSPLGSEAELSVASDYGVGESFIASSIDANVGETPPLAHILSSTERNQGQAREQHGVDNLSQSELRQELHRRGLWRTATLSGPRAASKMRKELQRLVDTEHGNKVWQNSRNINPVRMNTLAIDQKMGQMQRIVTTNERDAYEHQQDSKLRRSSARGQNDENRTSTAFGAGGFDQMNAHPPVPSRDYHATESGETTDDSTPDEHSTVDPVQMAPVSVNSSRPLIQLL